MTGAGAYQFRRVTAADLPLLAAWRTQPHVVQWWAEESGEVEEAFDDPRIAMWIGLEEFLRKLGMCEQRLLQICEDRKRFSEIDLGHVLELGNAGRCQETLEAKHAARRQRPEHRGIAGDDTAPESDVDVTAPVHGTQLRFQTMDVNRGGNAVEWHVDERCHTAGGRRSIPRALAPP